MEILFSMPETNVSIKKEYENEGYGVYPVKTLSGRNFYYVESGESGHDVSNQLFVAYWDKDDENMSADPNQSYMSFYTEQSGSILMVPVNSQEHMEKLLEKIQIEGPLGTIDIGE